MRFTTRDRLRVLRAAVRGEGGATVLEYGLLVAGVIALLVVAVFALGPVFEDVF